MPWLLVLLSAGALGLAFVAESTWGVALSLLASLGLFIAGLMGLLARRVGSRARDEGLMIDPAELNRLREQAEVRRKAAGTDPGAPAA